MRLLNQKFNFEIIKMKFILKSLFFIFYVAKASKFTEETPAPIYEHDLEIIDWYVQSVKGAWFGIYKGFYHDK